MGFAKPFLPGLMLAGAERQSVFSISGPAPSSHQNAMADYIETPGTQEFIGPYVCCRADEMLTHVSGLRQAGRYGSAQRPIQHLMRSNPAPRRRHPKTPSTVAISRVLKFDFFTKPGSPPSRKDADILGGAVESDIFSQKSGTCWMV